MLNHDCNGCDNVIAPCRATDNSACRLTGQDVADIMLCPAQSERVGAILDIRNKLAERLGIEDQFTALTVKANRDFFPWLVEEIIIESPEQLKNANDMLGIGKALVRDIESARRNEKKPIEAELKGIDERYRPFENRVSLGVTRLGEAVINYQKKVAIWNAAVLAKQESDRIAAEKAAEEQMKANAALIEEAKSTGEILPSTVYQPVEPQYPRMEAPVQSATKVKGNMSTSSVKTTYEYLVVDPDLVPKDLCSPDLAKIKARHKSGAKVIPGVLISEKQYTATRLG